MSQATVAVADMVDVYVLTFSPLIRIELAYAQLGCLKCCYLRSGRNSHHLFNVV